MEHAQNSMRKSRHGLRPNGTSSLAVEAEKSANKQTSQIKLQLHIAANVMEERGRALWQSLRGQLFSD